MKRLDGKVAIVTGASSGMGRTTALQFAAEGAKVVIAARREQESEEAVHEIKDNGGLSARGSDVWLDVSEEMWDTWLDTNLKGVWMCMRLQIPAMIEAGGGAIVNNSSLLGERGAGSAPYAASKHGVIGLTRSAAVAFGDKNIRVNAVLPGIIMTPIIEARLKDNPEAAGMAKTHVPMGHIGGPETIAEAVTWLCSDQANYVTGQTLTIDGGVMAQLFPKPS